MMISIAHYLQLQLGHNLLTKDAKRVYNIEKTKTVIKQ